MKKLEEGHPKGEDIPSAFWKYLIGKSCLGCQLKHGIRNRQWIMELERTMEGVQCKSFKSIGLEVKKDT